LNSPLGSSSAPQGSGALAPPVGAASGDSAESLLKRVQRDLPSILAVAAQFGLIVWIVHRFQLENTDLARVLKISLAGFVVHHFLPARFRLAFFALLSVGASIVILGALPGLALVGVGLALIGVCHLPLPFWSRAVLVALAGAALALVRANSQKFPDLTMIWAILGSMFAFRIMVYMYDLKHRAAPFSPARAIAYFFMIPNVCFPLFPIVDYKSFCTTYYNDQPTRIYQVGVLWMFRGVVQLILYRAVYQYGGLDITEVADMTGALRFIVSTYLLYLKVSGQFHLIVGLLHLFGFNLSETHHLYYLASSFTDFWRRINIYWKDFIMKLFFYPAFFPLRRLGTLPAMALATLAAFFATWALHSWQTFWVLGEFLFTWQDISFWTILALLVLANALQEAVGGRQRTLTKPRLDMRMRLKLGMKAAATFVTICLLWTLWSCQSAGELQALGESLLRVSAGGIVAAVAIPAAICALAMYHAGSHRENFEGSAAVRASQAPFAFWRSALMVGGSAAALLALPVIGPKLAPSAANVLANLSTDNLNARDANTQRRGYYEELEAARGANNSWRTNASPPGWNNFRRVIYRERGDFLDKDIVPGVSTVIAGAEGTTNSLGMRDREYSRKKPPKTFRALLFGASHELGTGVKDDETFENLVEDRLNREAPKSRYERFEIMNMAVGSASVLQRSVRLDQQGFALQPDAVVLVVFGPEKRFVVEHLAKVVINGYDLPYPFVALALEKAGVKGSMPELLIQQRLFPHAAGLVEEAFRNIARQCAERKTRLIVVYRPAAKDTGNVEAAAHAEVVELAQRAGLDLIDLSGVFDDVSDRETLVLAKWDDHTNALGHKMLADRLYEELVKRIGH
jgi:hypothetical protein